MARQKKTGPRPSSQLFRDPTGQQDLLEKTLEEQLTEVRDKTVECLGMTFENDEKRREFFLGKLRERLKDPEFRNIEGFPNGSDEDILALSEPPYYTACPNPFSGQFVQLHSTPYDPNADDYRREPFAADVSEGKNDPIYNAHAYHTKVPYLAVQKYIQHFTQPGDLVMDFFAGTGMTGVAARRASDGPRHAILVDLSPLATHVGAAFTSGVSLTTAARRAAAVLRNVRTKLEWVYQTVHSGWPAAERDLRKRVNRHEVNPTLLGTINFVVWSDVFICPDCSSEITYWDSAVDFAGHGVREQLPCPHCGSQTSKTNLERASVAEFDHALGRPTVVAKRVPVLVNYTYAKQRYEKTPDEFDLGVLDRVKALPIQHWFPVIPMMNKGSEWGDTWRAGYHQGMTHVHHFYSPRNLLALAALRDAVGADRFLLFWFTSTLPWCGRDNRLHISNYFGRKGGQITSLRGTWYIPSLSVETNVFERFKLRLRSALVDTSASGGDCLVSTSSATRLVGIPRDSIDYIFVDPPFGENLLYGELNFIWEAWLRVSTNVDKEAVISNSQEKNLFAYGRLMTGSFKEGFRVLKPGRWITVEFHNSKNSVWTAIQESLQQSGFVVADVRTLDKGKGSFKQVTSAGAVKRDLIISAYKPNSGLEERFRLVAGTEEGVWDFIRAHLRQLPVFVSKNGEAEVVVERQNYLLFDRMIAFHVQHGVTVPLSAAEFYAKLDQRLSERDGMYFLPEQVAEYDKKRMSAGNVLQLEFAPIDEATTILWLKQQLIKKPQTFQELHPLFLREIGGWQKHERLLELSELLEQNFLRYDATGEVPSQIHSYLSTNFKELRNLPKDAPALRAKGKDRWYVPDPNKAGDLERLRERALLREFWDYLPPGYKAAKPDSQGGFIPGLEAKVIPIPKGKKMKVIRLEAVRTGFRRCWQNRDYRTIIAVAQRIPEDVLQEDPKLLMWYDQAVTRMGEDK